MDEVIIDGCNVAECGFYIPRITDLNCACDMESSCKCIENTNCYYKQLQLLKAENETLKHKNKVLKTQVKEIGERISFLNSDRCSKMIKYKTAFKEIRESCNTYAKTEDYVIDQTFKEFLENVFIKINEVLEK